jgi:polyisoprenoid-binding protein YceI
MIQPRTLAFLFAAALSSAPALAAERYQIERPHTQIIFAVDHLGFSQSHGRFRDFDGELRFDAGDWSQSSVTLTVRTASVDMGDYEWDKHLKGKDFFDTNRFPEMTFRSTRVEQTGETSGKVHGELTLLGVTRPVVLDVTLNKIGKHPIAGKDWIGFSAHTTLTRSEFGMGYGLPAIGDQVKVELQVEGVKD